LEEFPPGSPMTSKDLRTIPPMNIEGLSTKLFDIEGLSTKLFDVHQRTCSQVLDLNHFTDRAFNERVILVYINECQVISIILLKEMS
jgi:hypothetical protein